MELKWNMVCLSFYSLFVDVSHSLGWWILNMILSSTETWWWKQPQNWRPCRQRHYHPSALSRAFLPCPQQSLQGHQSVWSKPFTDLPSLEFCILVSSPKRKQRRKEGMEGEEEEERKGSWRGRETGRDSLVIHLGLDQFFFFTYIHPKNVWCEKYKGLSLLILVLSPL